VLNIISISRLFANLTPLYDPDNPFILIDVYYGNTSMYKYGIVPIDKLSGKIIRNKFDEPNDCKENQSSSYYPVLVTVQPEAFRTIPTGRKYPLAAK
jgi:hypothetical protein